MATWREVLNTIAQNIPNMANMVLQYQDLELRQQQFGLAERQFGLAEDQFESRKEVEKSQVGYYDSYGTYFDTLTETSNNDLLMTIGIEEQKDNVVGVLEAIGKNKGNSQLLESLRDNLNLETDKLNTLLAGDPNRRARTEGEREAKLLQLEMGFMGMLTSLTPEDALLISEQTVKGDLVPAIGTVIKAMQLSPGAQKAWENALEATKTLQDVVVKSIGRQPPIMAFLEFMGTAEDGGFGTFLERDTGGLLGRQEKDEAYIPRLRQYYDDVFKPEYDQRRIQAIDIDGESFKMLFPGIYGILDQGEAIPGASGFAPGFRPGNYRPSPLKTMGEGSENPFIKGAKGVEPARGTGRRF